jgi:S-DNA-T family DNA segregation ATPase FtsK/SpoIIIE
VEYVKSGARREFLIRRESPRELPLGPLLAAKAQWLEERPGRLVVGQEADGSILTADLADAATPHLLIGGGTGSGKSWLLKSIIASLVHYHDPALLRLTLLDPKRVTFIGDEFQAAISAHRDGPVLYGLEDAMPCFARYIDLMEERYRRFEAAKAADLHEFNGVVKVSGRLPRHVIVMDEFSDLTAEKRAAQEFRTAVQRLGAKARAAGIHLILATQRPDKETVDASIKANLGGKIALRVASSVNSRIILDQGGAERLFGNGDLLADLGKGLVRAQAPVLDRISRQP